MKRRGLLHAELSRHVAALGHTHEVVVADCGLPLPGVGPAIVDLAVVTGLPTFTDVLDALLEEIVVDSAVLAEEAAGGVVERWLRDRRLAPSWTPHEQLKSDLPSARLVVRTGEATPFANVVLRCGVPF